MSKTLTLQAERSALVVIDLQRGIVGMQTQPHAPAEVVARSVDMLRAARAAGTLCVLVHVGGGPDGRDRLSPEADQPAPAGPSPAGFSDLVSEVGPEDGDIVILKRQWGAFYGTDLDLQLRRRGIDTVILCGIATEIGVESTARDAYERGYRLVFAADAMNGRSVEGHENSLQRIFPRMGLVRDTQTVVAALEAGR
ncbi:hypothetical protein BJI67_01705 [Acidihalobacter aeolianus]|uniref:Isochorismatase-like domain-containing protein n=1 Tax=Acidihalobacter aeolianus TaxID=2792603 RepID=A0A1D8K4S1_9GAMM|nr:hydrolase [Acidihalobacter aeolianus]AOV15959.1 hypothetical protein BJI67_01705 [Acidihalobacter aeolianus]